MGCLQKVLSLTSIIILVIITCHHMTEPQIPTDKPSINAPLEWMIYLHKEFSVFCFTIDWVTPGMFLIILPLVSRDVRSSAGQSDGVAVCYITCLRNVVWYVVFIEVTCAVSTAQLKVHFQVTLKTKKLMEEGTLETCLGLHIGCIWNWIMGGRYMPTELCRKPGAIQCLAKLVSKPRLNPQET